MVEFDLKSIYYFIFIRGKNKIYLSIARVNPEALSRLTVGKCSKTSLHVSNFLEAKYGGVKIYKSKKRMELRVQPKSLVADSLTISWDFADLHPTVINLRDVNSLDDMGKHIANEIDKFFS